jgi:hypothetical protein
MLIVINVLLAVLEDGQMDIQVVFVAHLTVLGIALLALVHQLVVNVLITIILS